MNYCLPDGIIGAVAITGGAPENAGENGDIIHQAVRDAVSRLAGHGLAILCSGTQWGVPLWAAESAIEFNLPLIRIHPQKAKKYLSNHKSQADIVVSPRCGESEWGDDSEVMIKLASGIIFIGGGTGTLIEFAHWAKINESRVKYNKNILYGVPLIGTGGVADMAYGDLRTLWQDKIAICLPKEPIQSGTLAADFLLEHMECTK
ncbi:MAG: hypothetical protein WCI52_02490 [bacterium]